MTGEERQPTVKYVMTSFYIINLEALVNQAEVLELYSDAFDHEIRRCCEFQCFHFLPNFDKHSLRSFFHHFRNISFVETCPNPKSFCSVRFARWYTPC